MNKKNINALTTGGIISALYIVITIISVYFFNVLSVLGLLIMPIFTSYYASIYNFKQTIILNISIMILSYISGIIDPLYPLFYVLPSLLIGDLYGYLSKKNIKYYTTIFLQAIAFSITNFLAIIIAEKVYEINIIQLIIRDKFILQNYSLSILFILSGAEATFSTMFVSEKLKNLNLIKQVENQMPIYGYMSVLFLFVSSIVFYFISTNIYYLNITMLCILSFPIFIDIYSKFKNKIYLLFIIFLILISLCYLLCFYKLFDFIPLLLLSVALVYSLVKIIIYIYNISTYKEK